MPSISKKAQTMPASPIRKLVPFSDAAKAKGIEVYHLNIGQPDLETPQRALEAVRNYTEKVVKYRRHLTYGRARKLSSCAGHAGTQKIH